MSTTHEHAGPDSGSSGEPGKNSAIARLISTIESTGGVVGYEDGTFGPVGDPDWIDLGDAYVAACNEAGRLPMVRSESLYELLGDGYA
jgi:hypothetical protein